MNDQASSAAFASSVSGPAAEREWRGQSRAQADVNVYIAEAHVLVWGLTQVAEAAIYLAAEMFAEDELMNYPRSFRLELGADNLVNIFEVYAGSGPEPPLIAHHVVVDTELVPLLANINDLTVSTEDLKKRTQVHFWTPWRLVVYSFFS